MKALRFFLVVVFASLFVYTLLVGITHGWNLLPIFFGEIADLNWQGQFNFDFTLILILAGLWVAWRNKFSAMGIVLCFCAVFGGILFLSLYLLILSYNCNNSISELLTGKN